MDEIMKKLLEIEQKLDMVLAKAPTDVVPFDEKTINPEYVDYFNKTGGVL